MINIPQSACPRPLTLEEAKQLIELDEGSPPPTESQRDEYEFASVPPNLKNSIKELAKAYFDRKLTMGEVELTLKDWKTRLADNKSSITVLTLKQDFQNELEQLQNEGKADEPEERPTLSGEQLQAARELGKGDLIVEFKEALQSLGYVADEYTTLALMHTIYARLLNSKTGWLHYGRSRSGKSAGLDAAFKLLHPMNRMRATSMTTGAIYTLGHLDHKFILGGELRIMKPGDDDEIQRVLRQFLSEPEITHHRLEEHNSKAGRRYKRTEHTVTGNAAIAWTTTTDPYQLKDEFAVRLTSVASNESANITAQVMELKAKLAQHPLEAADKESKTKQQFNEFDLSLEAKVVVIPFADLIKPRSTDTTIRGIYELLLEHIKISALIHQHDREEDADGCLIATKEDYIAAISLVSAGAFQILASMSTPAMDAFHQLVASVGNATDLTLKEIIKILNKPRPTVQGYISGWLKAELIVESDQLGKNRSKQYTIIDTTGSVGPGLGLIPVEEAFPDQKEVQAEGADSAEKHSAPRKPLRISTLGCADGAEQNLGLD